MRRLVCGAVAIAGCLAAVAADAAPVTFVKLAGSLVGGSPAATAVYKADLSGNGNALSITIADSGVTLAGAPGEFSGFDFDAIVLSYTDISDTVNLSTVMGSSLAVFDFSSAGTFFTPGTQRSPSDPKLFGTDATGTQVDNSVATLGAFDANSIAGPGAFGFISLGDGGVLSFNLSSAVNTTGLRLYIGEVGDNGEVAAGQITVSQNPVTTVPEPATLTLLCAGLLAAAVGTRKRRELA